jgi:chaperonin GroEL (HSP60 family)
MSQQMGNQPLIVLSDDSQRTSGKDAQSMNITAGKAVSESVRTTLGPKGMDKMLVDSTGNVVVTNDGVTILKEMEIEHPAANMIVEVAETQENEVGDGTTRAVVVAGELLKKAEDQLDQEIHATTLAQGYRQAAEKAKEALDEIAIDVEESDTEILENIAATAMTGKGAENARDHLASLVVQAVRAVADEEGIDTDNIKVEDVVGGAIEESELVEGVIVSKERVHDDMPYAVEDANVAVLDDALEVRETEIDAEVNVTDPDQLQEFLDQEEEQLKEMVDDLVDAGADVVFAQDGIDDMAQHFLAQEGILAARRVKSSDADKLARATGAAALEPLPPFSMMTATAISGSSTGAKAMNSAWSRSSAATVSASYSSSCAIENTWAVPVLPAMVFGLCQPIARAVPRSPSVTPTMASMTYSQSEACANSRGDTAASPAGAGRSSSAPSSNRCGRTARPRFPIIAVAVANWSGVTVM